MTRLLIPALALLLQAHALPALAATSTPQLPDLAAGASGQPASTPDRTLAQNSRIELPVPPPPEPVPPAPPLRHLTRYAR